MKRGDEHVIRGPLPIEAGQQFCLTHPYSQEQSAELLRVQEISPQKGEVTLVVTAWGKTD